uniref:3'-5' exonuclease domain-containing protein n=1 Tax=Timema tahoe TaxID=61484 RepID=A0A7R9FN28_9NEOP|nr:unnamed protein product [Timema tahoe]
MHKMDVNSGKKAPSVDSPEPSTSSSNETKEEEFTLPGYKSLDDFIKTCTAALVQSTQLSNKLPSKDNWEYYMTFNSFQKTMKSEGTNILHTVTKILSNQKVKGNISQRDVDEQLDLVVDANDTILEHVANNLDEMDGIRRNPEVELIEAAIAPTISGSWNVNKQMVVPNVHRPNHVNHSSAAAPTVRLLTAKNIERPQVKFKDRLDNSSTPFEPRIKDKPNALKPLSILLEMSENGECYSHPYEYELDRFKSPEDQLKKVKPTMYKSLEETPLFMVGRPEELADMAADLAKYSEIAVDLEHHSYRTFQGITCLMQISTRDTDYIIDTLELRDKLHCLNDVFTNPSVVKVFHGADHDVEWLQRDLSVYLVNLFDTHQAAKALNFPHLSLAYLLQHYCKVTANKQYQLADWRIRPLPKELRNYAREDTHYLLYIYDTMKNALLDAANGKTNILESVLQQSTEICKKRYWKPILTEDSHMGVYRHSKKLFDNQQMFALKELYRWRDKVAREEDESIGELRPPMHPVIELRPPMHPVIELRPPMHPVIELRPPMHPVIELRPPMHPVSELRPPMHPVLCLLTLPSEGDLYRLNLTMFILPNHMMLQIADTLPREMQGILACCNPIPTTVRKNLVNLHQIVLKAREQPLTKLVLEEEILRVRVPAPSWQKINLDGALHCPHDLSRVGDFRDDLPTLMGDTSAGSKRAPSRTPPLVQRAPNVTVFQPLEAQQDDDYSDLTMKPSEVKQLTFVCPYERYKLVRPYMDAQNASEQEALGRDSVQVEEGEGDEDRIRRIRDHFFKVSAVAVKSEPKPPVAKEENVEPLRKQLTKKRKHPETDTYNEGEEELAPSVLQPRQKHSRTEELAETDNGTSSKSAETDETISKSAETDNGTISKSAETDETISKPTKKKKNKRKRQDNVNNDHDQPPQKKAVFQPFD